jgi:glycosyltransferase involved in cell wall biosynthesis
MVAWMCRLFTSTPIVYSGHNTLADELPSFKLIRPAWLARAVGKVADWFLSRVGHRCLPHSENMARFFKQVGLESRTEPVVNFGINLAQMSPRTDGAEVRRRYGLGSGPVVVHVGLLSDFQRLDLLVEAMKTVVQVQPRAKLFIVVTVPDDKQVSRLRRQAEELGIADNLVVTEPQQLRDVPEFLAAGNVGVAARPGTPGLSIKLLNYMTARRPCVLFKSAASTGMVHHDNVMLADPDTSTALGETILELLKDEPLRQRIADNGHRFVHANHDRRVIARQICDVYARLLASRKRTSILGIPCTGSNGL